MTAISIDNLKPYLYIELKQGLNQTIIIWIIAACISKIGHVVEISVHI